MGGRGGGSGMGRGGGGHKVFPDKADGTHTYEGDGKAQLDFFGKYSNYDELISNMSYDQRDDFRDWARGHFMWGQQYRGWDAMDDEDKRLTQVYDDVLDRSTLSRGVVLTRRSDAQLIMGAGVKTARMSEFQAMEGQIITSKGNMSFGAASQGLTIGASGKKVEYRVSIDKGTTGAGMWIGDKRINGWGAKQREFMTNRDAAFKVGKTKYDSARDVFVVDLHYEGHTAHDYGTTGRVKSRR